jgi:hypothetical protein
MPMRTGSLILRDFGGRGIFNLEKDSGHWKIRCSGKNGALNESLEGNFGGIPISLGGRRGGLREFGARIKFNRGL